MHPKTRSHNGYLQATESRETTQKLSFGPKEVDWASLLRKNKTQLRKHKVVHFMHTKTRSHNLYLPATKSRETTQKLSFGPKEVDWACWLRKNKTQLRKHKAVHCMHPKTRSHNGYLPATESRETTQASRSGLGKIVAKKQDATSKAQSVAFYAPQNPISQLVPPGNGITRNHPET